MIKKKVIVSLMLSVCLIIALFLTGCAQKEDETIKDKELFPGNLLTTKTVASIEDEEPYYFVLRKCSVLDKEGKAYYLNEELATEENNCLKITADEVTLDCQGNFIRGEDKGIGIYLDKVEKVTVQNCKVTDFEDAVWLESSQNNYIYKNTLTDNEGNGLVLRQSSNNHLAENVIDDNDKNGIYLIYSSNNNELSSNQICDNDRKDVNCQLSKGNIDIENSYETFATCSDNFPNEENHSNCDNKIKCQDSDGENIFTKGQVIGYWLGPNSANPLVAETDVCIDNDTIKEYICNEEGNNILSKEIECLAGCEDGACLPEEGLE